MKLARVVDETTLESKPKVYKKAKKSPVIIMKHRLELNNTEIQSLKSCLFQESNKKESNHIDYKEDEPKRTMKVVPASLFKLAAKKRKI